MRVVTAEESLEDRQLAGQAYRKDLIGRFARAKFQHIDLCTTAYLHTKSGGLGAEDLGVDPASESNAARHVKSALGLDASKPYRKFIYVPQWSCRSRREILPLEVLRRCLPQFKHQHKGADISGCSLWLKHLGRR